MAAIGKSSGMGPAKAKGTNTTVSKLA